MREGKPAQVERLGALLADGRAHRTDEILAAVYGSEHCGCARIGARIWDLKKRGRKIDSWRDKRDGKFSGMHWYQDVTDAEAKGRAIAEEDERFAAAKRLEGVKVGDGGADIPVCRGTKRADRNVCPTKSEAAARRPKWSWLFD